MGERTTSLGSKVSIDLTQCPVPPHSGHPDPPDAPKTIILIADDDGLLERGADGRERTAPSKIDQLVSTIGTHIGR